MTDGSVPCSAQVIVRDAASSIGRCLEGLRAFAQVVVQDGGSADGTRDVARSFPNVTLLNQSPAHRDADGRIVDFSAVRNDGLRASVHDWIFAVDADEEVPAATVEAIAAAVAQGQPAAYRVFRRFMVDGKRIDRCAGYPAYQIRFFHRSCVDGYVKPIHEKPAVKKGAEVRVLDGEILSPMPPARDLEPKYARYLAMELARVGVPSWRTWFRWILWRNVRSVVGLGLRVLWIWITPGRGMRMPFAYDWQAMRQSIILAARTFPPLARRRADAARAA